MASDVFTWLFCAEAVIKIIARGFFMSANSYLRDVGNCFDFVVAVSGIVEFCLKVPQDPSLGGTSNAASTKFLKPLRVLRVVRPLKSINALPSMREQVKVIITSLPELSNVGVFLGFVFFLFSILGLQEFCGSTYARCRTTEKPINATYWPKSSQYTAVCSPDGAGYYHCPATETLDDGTVVKLTCGAPSKYNISLADDGVYEDVLIQYGIATFDNIFWSFISVF